LALSVRDVVDLAFGAEPEAAGDHVLDADACFPAGLGRVVGEDRTRRAGCPHILLGIDHADPTEQGKAVPQRNPAHDIDVEPLELHLRIDGPEVGGRGRSRELAQIEVAELEGHVGREGVTAVGLEAGAALVARGRHSHTAHADDGLIDRVFVDLGARDAGVGAKVEARLGERLGRGSRKAGDDQHECR
jgi:hypothetical protein